jgi:hypothetical protein
MLAVAGGRKATPRGKDSARLDANLDAKSLVWQASSQ